MKPAKLIKSANLSSPAGARDIDFGAASAEARRLGDYSKGADSVRVTSRHGEYDDVKAREKNWLKRMTS